VGKHAMIAAITPRLLDEETAAAYVGRGKTRFREDWEAGRIPGPCDQNGNVRLWDLKLLDRYVDQRSGLGSPLGSWD
jgi:hypothetical protein